MSPTQLAMLSILGWGIGSLFYKVANDNIHPLMVSIVVTGVYVVLDIITLTFIPFNRSINSTGLLYSILGAVFMCIGSLGYFYALRGGGSVGTTTVLTSLYPAVTLVLAYFFMREAVSLKQGIGIIFAIIAFILLGLK